MTNPDYAKASAVALACSWGCVLLAAAAYLVSILRGVVMSFSLLVWMVAR